MFTVENGHLHRHTQPQTCIASWENWFDILKKSGLVHGWRYENVASQIIVYIVMCMIRTLKWNFHNFSLGVSAQCDENFNCTFSGCPGTNLTCCCSVQSYILWWSSNNISGAENFCIPIGKNQTDSNRSQLDVVVEVANRSSEGFISKLVWSSISTELNGTVIGCSHSQSVCSRDRNFTLLVTGCQGNGIRI